MNSKKTTFRSFSEARRALEAKISGPTDTSLEAGTSRYLEYLRLHGFKRLRDLRLSVYFGRHSTASDADHVLRNLKGKDVWLIEQNRRSSNIIPVVQEISGGTMSPEDAVGESAAARSPYFMRLMRGVYGTGIRTAVVDTPETREESAQASSASDQIRNFADDVQKEHWTYVEALKNFAERVARFAAVQIPRETRMALNVPQAIMKAYAGAKIETVESVSVLMVIGAGHKPVFERILSNHPGAVLSESAPNIYTYVDEYIRAAIDGSSISNTLIENALIQILLERIFREAGVTIPTEPDAYSDFIRRTVDQMTGHERRDFFTLFLVPGENLFQYSRDLAIRK